MKKFISLWWSWSWRNIATVILILALFFVLGKFLLSFFNIHIGDYLPKHIFIPVFIIICNLVFVYNLRTVLAKYYCDVGFKKSSLIFLSWLLRFVPSSIVVLLAELYFGILYRFSSVWETRGLASYENAKPVGLKVDIFSLRAMPGDLVILFFSIWFLKIAIENNRSNRPALKN